jgi:hypothetical protein
MMPAISIVVLDWIINGIYITLIIPIALLLLRYRSLSPPMKWFMFALVWHIIASMGSEALYKNNINPNYGGSSYYIFAIIFYLVFFQTLFGDARTARMLWVIGSAHIVFAACNVLFIQKETINTYSAISHSAIVISLCLLFFYRLLKNLPTDNLLNLPVFWFVTSEFLVNTGQMLMKSFAHFLINIFNDNLIVLWVFHHGLGIAGNLLVIYGSWLFFTRSAGISSRQV